ncbi:MAG: hypothetical protein ACOY7T_04520 [Pseudomonadota bacterium]
MPDRRPGLLAAGLIGAALLALTSPLGARPEAAAAALSAAVAAAERGEGIAVEAELRKALSAGASRTDVAARMGEAYLLQGKLRNAREWLEPAQFVATDQALGWRMTGRLLRLEGKLPEAGKAFDKALALAPNDPLLWVDIARLRYVGGEHLLAVEAAGRALQAGPENLRAIELRAQLLNDSAGPVAAIPLFERGLAAAPDDLALLIGYAGALGEAGRAVDLLATARRINQLDPRSPVPYYFQAVIAARAGQIDFARNLLNRNGNRLGEVPAAQMLQAALELEAGNSAMAVDMLERLDRRQPFNVRVQLLFARALLAVDDHVRLRQRFAPLAARPDASPYLLTVLGRSYERTGDRAAAAALLDRAATAGALPFAARERANVPAPPGSFEGFVLAGDNALLKRANGDALAAYSRAAQVRFPEWLMLRAAYATGSPANGALLAGQYLAAYPGSLLAPRLVAGGAAQSGDWARAALLLDNADRRLGHGDVRLLADLSLAQLRSGDTDAALASADKAYDLQRSSPVAALAKGMALAKLGRDPEQVRALLDKAERIGGTNPLIKEARAQLRR